VEADHGQYLLDLNIPRLIEPSLAGGALLDLGIYPVSLAHMVLGVPARITATGVLTDKGVDSQTSAILDYRGGAQAVVTTTLTSGTPCRATITGTKGRIEIDRTFYNPTTWRVINHKDEVIGGSDKRYVGHGLREEAIEFARCFRAGEKESPMLPLDETLSIMGTITEIANQIGLKFEKFAQ